MALVKKMNVCVIRGVATDSNIDLTKWHVSWFADDYDDRTNDRRADGINADLNRAIVECVAKMQATALATSPKTE